MSLLDVDSWSRECEACSALYQTLLLKLQQRDKRWKNSIEYQQLTSLIQVELKQFEGQVRELKQKLNILQESNSIDAEELDLKKQQVDILQTQLIQVGRKATQNDRWERAELFAQSSHPPLNSAQSSNDNTLPTEKIADVNDLKQRQIDILEHQNRGLEVLSQTLSRQKNIASQLRQEVESQNDILDDMADTMERVDARVHVETGNLSDVSRRDSTWGYWVVIMTLFIAILVVAII